MVRRNLCLAEKEHTVLKEEDLQRRKKYQKNNLTLNLKYGIIGDIEITTWPH